MVTDNTNAYDLRLLLQKGRLKPHELSDIQLTQAWGQTWSPSLGTTNDWKIMQESLNAEAAYRWIQLQRKSLS